MTNYIHISTKVFVKFITSNVTLPYGAFSYASYWFKPPRIPAFRHHIHRHHGNLMLILLSTSLATLYHGFLLVVLSHHVNANLSNPSLHSSYTNINNIMISDDTRLPITHTSSTSLITPITTFSLNNVLCVPSMKKKTWFQSLNFAHQIMYQLNSYFFRFLWRNFAWGQSF